MSKFERKFDFAPLKGKVPAWWTDLLGLWAPSGSNRPNGLRMALRNNYLNFYIDGQSVGRVSINSVGLPSYVSVHEKYVDPSATGQGYVKFGAGDIALGRGQAGEAGVAAWIANAKTYSNEEKRFVDNVVGQNAAVLDLEIGLPSIPGHGQGAKRIDLASLEQLANGRIAVVFWEAKLINDSRLASCTEATVVQQLNDYATFLRENKEQVRDAYANVCHNIADIHVHACEQHNLPSLSELLLKVHRDPSLLDVDVMPRLLICDNGKGTSAREPHIDKLAAEWPVLRLSLQLVPVKAAGA